MDAKKSILVVGLAGGIASGKSLVASMLGDLGARVLNADEINHEVLLEPEIVKTIVAEWGADVLDAHGRLDRRKLGEMVFSDVRQVKKLEGILHPEVLRRILAAITEESARSPRRVVVIDAPLLFEAGLSRECDLIVFIDVPEDIRLERTMLNRHWDRKELLKREKHQKPSSYKRAHADIVLTNSASAAELKTRVEKLWDDLTRLNPQR